MWVTELNRCPLVAMAVVFGLLLTGCSPKTPEAAATNSPSPVVSVASSVPPLPEPLDRAAAVKYVLAENADQGKYSDFKMKFDETKYRMLMTNCEPVEMLVSADEAKKNQVLFHTREFHGGDGLVGQIVMGSHKPAAPMVARDNKDLATCTRQEVMGGGAMTISRNRQFVPPKGAEGAEMFCRNEFSNGSAYGYYCSVTLGKGEIFCIVYASGRTDRLAIAMLEAFLPQIALRMEKLPA